MHSPIRALPALLAIWVSTGCGSTPPPDPWYPRALGPTEVLVSEAERAILDRLDEISGEGEVSVGATTAFVEAPYYAASDRRCRRVRFSNDEGRSLRTACESPDGWRLAADVFHGGAPR